MKSIKAFTLVELLVVIAIIAVLMSILMPALQTARMQATGAVCLGNQRALSQAYALYTDDNDGRLVGSYVTSPDDGLPYDSSWVCLPMAEDGTILNRGSSNPDGTGGDFATLEDRQRGIRAGKIYPYVESYDIYHCPGDDRIKNGTYAGSSLVHRVFRSYSIQFGLNNPGQDGLCPEGKGVIRRFSELRNPGATYSTIEEPGGAWVFNCNTGFILDGVNFSGWWWSIVPNWHRDNGTLGFVDGHAETRRWVDDRTRNLEFSSGFGDMDDAYQPDNPDLHYIFRGYAINKYWDQSWMVFDN